MRLSSLTCIATLALVVAGCGTSDAPPRLGESPDVGIEDSGGESNNASDDAGTASPTDSGTTSDALQSPDMDNGDSGTPPDMSGPLAIYMAPDGDDALDGSTPERAVLSLNRVQQLIGSSEPRNVDVRIALGTYYAQKVRWDKTFPEHTIRFTRWPLDAPERPVFDGCTGPNGDCPGGTWFHLDHSAGEETNLSFRYVRVQNYGTAISMNGNRNAEATSNGSNRIYGCYFYNIGNEFNPSLPPSTAAVRLVNSDDNQIENNHFVNVVNTTSGGLIHALYIAHMSDRNVIRANRFKRSSGDPVRLRDYSNDNDIRDNRFIQVGTHAGYTDWYCDHDVRDDCTKVGPECPSWGNEFRDNLLDGKFDCSALSTFNYFQDDSTTGCTPPMADSRRLRTSGNVQHEPACTSE